MAVQAEAVMVEPPPPPFDPRIHEAAVTQDHGPPPISGGTLATLPGGRLLVADPDTDRVLVVASGETPRLVLELAGPRGNEPGRAVFDTHGRAHVVLRGTGEVLSFDPSATTVDAAHVERRAVCSMPRGLAFDEGADRLVVVCRGGELVWLPAGSGAVSRTVMLEPDLRDVVLANDQLVVTRFRSAEALVVDRADGHLVARRNLAPTNEGGVTSSAAVAWRAIPLPTGEIAMLHQRERDDDVVPAPGGYGGFGGCDGIVKSTISVLSGDRFAAGPVLAAATLPVDLAARNDGGRLGTLAVVAAGNQNGQRSVFLVSEGEVRSEGCSGGGWISAQHSLANAVAVSFLEDGRLAVQTRAPARLVLIDTNRGSSMELALGGADTFDTGHAIFHASAGGHIACASCHPEGGEDGHVWRFSGLGPRRTPALHDVAGTAPFHWEGDLASIDALTEEVFVRRMSGVPLQPTHTAALEGWLGHLRRPSPHVSADAARVTRGRAVFEGAGGCVACHSGPHLSDGQSHDVGTGRAFQTPTLHGVVDRLPAMHDGCARTLRDRFTPSCGGERHGGAVSGEALDDLLAYLETL
jgi:mono/diheme cytochrome c family protein